MVLETLVHGILFAYQQFVAYSIVSVPHFTNESQLANSSANAVYLKDIQWSQNNFYRYYTNWNLFLQYLFVIFLLVEDFLRLTRFFPKLVHDKMSIFNSYIFFSLVFPVCVVVASTFWPLFLFDKSLIWPDYTDEMISFELNLMLHAIIVVVALLILIFFRRPLPKVLYSMIVLFLYNGAYGLLTIETFYEQGRWVYVFQEQIGLVWNIASGLPLHILSFVYLFLGRFLSQLIHGEVVYDKNRFDVQK